MNTSVYSIIDKCKELDNLMNATDSAWKVRVPRLKSDEIKGLQDLWKIYESHHEEIRAALLRMVSEQPEFKFILAYGRYPPSIVGLHGSGIESGGVYIDWQMTEKATWLIKRSIHWLWRITQSMCACYTDREAIQNSYARRFL